jgi:hypothetical protein
MPDRIRLERTKGWRLPEGAVRVARPTRWGNPFVYRSEHRSLPAPGEPDVCRAAVLLAISNETETPDAD